VIVRPVQFLILVILLSLVAAQTRAQQTAGPVPAQPSSSASSGSSGPAAPQAQSTFQGSVPGKLEPGVLQISLQDAINRGLKTNLGLLLSEQDIGSARGERWKKLSSLLPNITTTSYVDGSLVDLAEYGFNFKTPPGSGFTIPSIVGPFGYFDSRAYLTQSMLDLNALNNTRAATQNMKAAQYTAKDARDLVVLAVGYNYLQAIADASRIESVGAQVNTAQALYNQASDQVNAGTSPAIDGLRAQVELKTRQQQLIQAKNDFAIQKLTLLPASNMTSPINRRTSRLPGCRSKRHCSALMPRAPILWLPALLCVPPNIRRKQLALNTIPRYLSARITVLPALTPRSTPMEFSMCAAL
jgi:outer membrane protein TolC